MNIGFIGAGKAGFSLAKYFSINKIKLSGFFSRNIFSATEASSFTNSNAYESISQLVSDSDIIFITTPDSCISDVWNQIKLFNLKNKIICHISGSLDSKLFSNINELGAFGYSIHPMYAFSNKLTSYKNLNSAYFSIEGDPKHIQMLKELFTKLGNKVFVIDAEAKPLYHLSSVTVSNLVLSLINIGCNHLKQCGLNEEDALNALMPLIENNIDNIKNNGFNGSLTGPVERNDLTTIKKHLAVVPYNNIRIYKYLSLNLVKLSRQKHKDRNYTELTKLLE